MMHNCREGGLWLLLVFLSWEICPGFGLSCGAGQSMDAWVGLSSYKLMTSKLLCLYCWLFLRLKAYRLRSGGEGTCASGSQLVSMKETVPALLLITYLWSLGWCWYFLLLSKHRCGLEDWHRLLICGDLPTLGPQYSWLWRSTKHGDVQQEVLMPWAPGSILLAFSFPFPFQRATKLHRTPFFAATCTWMTVLLHTLQRYHTRYVREQLSTNFAIFCS